MLDINVEQEFVVRGFSLPSRPVSFGENYEFPEDVTRLSSDQLGQLMSKLAAYRGYVFALYARYEIKRRMLEEEHRIRIAEECRSIAGRTQKAIKEEASLVKEVREVGEKLLSEEKNTIFCHHLGQVYTGQIECLSRELSRRAMARE